MYLYEFLHKASFTSTGRFGDPETSKGIYDGLKYKYSLLDSSFRQVKFISIISSNDPKIQRKNQLNSRLKMSPWVLISSCSTDRLFRCNLSRDTSLEKDFIDTKYRRNSQSPPPDLENTFSSLICSGLKAVIIFQEMSLAASSVRLRCIMEVGQGSRNW